MTARKFTRCDGQRACRYVERVQLVTASRAHLSLSVASCEELAHRDRLLDFLPVNAWAGVKKGVNADESLFLHSDDLEDVLEATPGLSC